MKIDKEKLPLLLWMATMNDWRSNNLQRRLNRNWKKAAPLLLLSSQILQRLSPCSFLSILSLSLFDSLSFFPENNATNLPSVLLLFSVGTRRAYLSVFPQIFQPFLSLKTSSTAEPSCCLLYGTPGH